MAGPKAKQFTLGTAILWLAGDDTKLKSFLKGAETQIQASWTGLSKAAGQLNDEIMAAHDTVVKGLEIAAGVATGIAVAAAGAGVALFKMGLDADAVDLRFRRTMGSMADSADEWATAFAKSMRLDDPEIKETVMTFDLMLKNMGDSEKDALDKSEILAKRAYDLAAYMGLPTVEAQDLLQKGLAGQYRGLKELGIVIQGAVLNQQALAMGYQQSYGQLNQLDQTLVRYNEIMRQTSFSDGAFKTSMGTNTQTVKAIAAGLKEIGESIGQDMTAAGGSFLTRVSDGIWELKAHIDEFAPDIKTFFGWLSRMGDIAWEAANSLLAAFGIDLGLGTFTNAMYGATYEMRDFVTWWDTGGREKFEDWAARMKTNFDVVVAKVRPIAAAIWDWVTSHEKLLLSLGAGLVLYPLIGAALHPLADGFQIANSSTALLANGITLVNGVLKLFSGLLGISTAAAFGLATAIAAIGLSLASFYEMWTNKDWSHNFVTDLVDSFPTAKNYLDELFSAWLASLKSFDAGVIAELNATVDTVERLWGRVNYLFGTGGWFSGGSSMSPMGEPNVSQSWLDWLLPSNDDTGLSPGLAQSSSSTVNNGPIHAPIYINGAQSPEATGAAVQKALVELERSRRGASAGFGATFA